MEGPRKIFAHLLTLKPTPEQLVWWMNHEEELDRLLKGTELAAFIYRGAGPQRGGVLGALNMVADSLKLLPKQSETQQRWTTEEWARQKSGWLFLTSIPRFRERLLPLMSLWLDTLVLRLMNQGDPAMRHAWFVLDELASLQRLPQLHTALTENRKSGNPVVIGFQGRSQLEVLYGHEAEAMLSQPATKIFLHTSEPRASKWISDTIGEVEMERLKESVNIGQFPRGGRSRNYHTERRVEPLVLPSEISGLPRLHALDNLVVPFSFPYLAPVNNQITTSGYSYDAAGNTLTDGTPNLTFAYDGENRIKSAAGVNYTYDGDGKRVKKDSGKLYWTGTGSDPLEESDLSGNINEEYAFFNGKRIARVDLPSGIVHYYFSDQLGSASVITNATGTTIEQESDYYPYGGERVLTSGVNNYKFTGKERDSESGLDDFEARYYSSSMGRFMSPDEFSGGPMDVFDPTPNLPSPLPYALISNPQSLNKYVYAYNNPLRYIDPDGHDVKDIILLTSGPNNVPNTPHPEVTDASRLGPKDERSGGYFALNTQSVFDSGDNPSDYRTIRSAYILNGEGNVSQTRTGAEENPDKSQTAVDGSSKFVFDSPGFSAQPKSALYGYKTDLVFSVQEQNRKTGDVSAPTLYYRVQVGYNKDGKLVTQVNTITRDEFLRLTGQNKKKDKKKKVNNQ